MVRTAVQATLGIGEGCSEQLAHYARYLFFKHKNLYDFERFIKDGITLPKHHDFFRMDMTMSPKVLHRLGPVAWCKPPTASTSSTSMSSTTPSTTMATSVMAASPAEASAAAATSTVASAAAAAPSSQGTEKAAIEKKPDAETDKPMAEIEKPVVERVE